MSEAVGRSRATCLGEMLEYDPKNTSGFLRTFMRLRVLIDVRRPLLRTKKIRKEGGLPVMVTFKYEKLGSFCYLCGLLGHNNDLCPQLLTIRFDSGERNWGPELRADTRLNSGGGGARWLREDMVGGGQTLGCDTRRNQWTGAVTHHGNNGANNSVGSVMEGPKISQRMVDAFKNPQSLFKGVNSSKSASPSGDDVSSNSGDQHMEERESEVCDVVEIEKKRRRSGEADQGGLLA